MKLSTKIISVLLALITCMSIVVACNKEDGGNEDVTTTAQPVLTTPIVADTTPVSTKPKETLAPPITLDTTTFQAALTSSFRDSLNFDLTAQIPEDGVITTAAQLQAVLTSGVSNADYTVNAKELDCAGLGWEGLKNYSGTFDFAGCVVKNASCPMFLTVKNGTVKNLTIAESKYNYNDTDSEKDTPILTAHTARIYYAPVVSYLNGGTVDNIVIESSVEINTNIFTKGAGIGGVVGWANGANMTISNCTFKGKFYTDSGAGYFGGIVGNFEGSSYSFNQNNPESASSKIINCTNYGTVTEEDNSNDSKLGGIAGGIVTSAVIRCANYGTITSGNSGQTAGVVAYVYGNTGVVYCLNAGAVKVENRGGGICAYSNGSNRWFYGCVNTGRITSSTSSGAGIVGIARSKESFVKCYNYSRNAAAAIKNVNEKTVNLGSSPTNVESLTVKECNAFTDLAKVYEAVSASCPGVFAYDAATGAFTLPSAKTAG